MSPDKLSKWINQLIANNELYKFYKSKEWQTLKKQVLESEHYECAECKKRGIITRSEIDKRGRLVPISTVHHIWHVREFPHLALSRECYVNGEWHTNLIPVCKACHNRLHPEKGRYTKSSTKKFSNEEWW